MDELRAASRSRPSDSHLRCSRPSDSHLRCSRPVSSLRSEAVVSGIAAWLQATGPYGIVAILGWAFWKINERKDAALRELYERVAEMGRAQTEATVKVEAALVALKEAIEEMHDPPGTSGGATG